MWPVRCWCADGWVRGGGGRRGGGGEGVAEVLGLGGVVVVADYCCRDRLHHPSCHHHHHCHHFSLSSSLSPLPYPLSSSLYSLLSTLHLSLSLSTLHLSLHAPLSTLVQASGQPPPERQPPALLPALIGRRAIAVAAGEYHVLILTERGEVLSLGPSTVRPSRVGGALPWFGVGGMGIGGRRW